MSRHIIKITIDANFDDIADDFIDAINDGDVNVLTAIFSDIRVDPNITLKAEYHDPIFGEQFDEQDDKDNFICDSCKRPRNVYDHGQVTNNGKTYCRKCADRARAKYGI